MAIQIQIEDIANADVNYAEKALVPPFKFSLVEYLHRDNGRVLDGTVQHICQEIF
jgi:hypothetical protein